MGGRRPGNALDELKNQGLPDSILTCITSLTLVLLVLVVLEAQILTCLLYTSDAADE